MKRWSIITKKDHLRFVHRKELKRKDIGYASPFYDIIVYVKH